MTKNSFVAEVTFNTQAKVISSSSAFLSNYSLDITQFIVINIVPFLLFNSFMTEARII